KEHSGSHVVINAFKKADASCRLVIRAGNLKIDKCGYTAKKLIVFACEHPACSSSMFKIRICSAIENIIDMPVKRANPYRVILIYAPRCVKYQFPFLPVSYLCKLHNSIDNYRYAYLLLTCSTTELYLL